MVKIGNNTSLPINYVGSPIYTSSYIDHKFSLHNLLYVPLISKNLLSVSKFARDNNVLFEF